MVVRTAIIKKKAYHILSNLFVRHHSTVVCAFSPLILTTTLRVSEYYRHLKEEGLESLSQNSQQRIWLWMSLCGVLFRESIV